MPYIEEAARQGARLAVLPEMYLSGYIPGKEIWDSPEPEGGPAEQWLASTSKRPGIYMGAGLAQADGEDFYDTFVIMGPDGRVAGRTRKTQTEFMVFGAGEIESHVIDTPIGRIGVGICADNHMTFLPRLMQERSVDILLMPHAWPVPYRLSRIIGEKDIVDADEKARAFAAFYAGMLGVPVVLADQTGGLEGVRGAGILGWLMDAGYMRYAGNSTIVDSDLAARARAGRHVGLLISTSPSTHRGRQKAPYPTMAAGCIRAKAS